MVAQEVATVLVTILVGELLEQTLDEEQAEELREVLRSQSDATRRFAEQMQLASMLEEELPLEAARWQKEAVAQRGDTRVGRRRFFLMLMPIVATAAALLVALTGPFDDRSDPGVGDLPAIGQSDGVLDPGVAIVTQVVDARWNTGQPIAVGSSIAPGVFKLQSGLAQLEFFRGAVVVVEGPAELEFVDTDRLVCSRGKLRAHVPPQAEGFTILSTQFELVDLGTEFGVDIEEGGSDSVHVFGGAAIVLLVMAERIHAALVPTGVVHSTQSPLIEDLVAGQRRRRHIPRDGVTLQT